MTGHGVGGLATHDRASSRPSTAGAVSHQGGCVAGQLQHRPVPKAVSTRRGFAGSTPLDVVAALVDQPKRYSSRSSAGRGTRSTQPRAPAEGPPAPGTTASHSSVTDAWRRSGSASRKRTHRSSTFGGSATVAAAGRDAAAGVAAAGR